MFELFQKYAYNNALHSLVCGIVEGILNGMSNVLRVSVII
jgi:hypothetical protein